MGLLLFALRPIERAADRFAERVMPRVTESPDCIAFRKHEVYKATVEDMLADGSLSPKDRRVLAGMRRRLGIADAMARALERDAATARRAA